MEFSRYLDLFDADVARVEAVATPDQLDVPVPTCPGWLVRDVVAHLAFVYLHKVECIRNRAEPDVWPPKDVDASDPVGLMRTAHASLRKELVERGPDAPAYTWHPPDQTVGFWYRRMALETVVHRLDVELAVDDVTAIPADLAIDGIDEVLTLMLAGDWSEAPVPRAPYTIELRAEGSSDSGSGTGPTSGNDAAEPRSGEQGAGDGADAASAAGTATAAAAAEDSANAPDNTDNADNTEVAEGVAEYAGDVATAAAAGKDSPIVDGDAESTEKAGPTTEAETGAWIVRLEPTRITVDAAGEPGADERPAAAAVAAPPVALFRWLWGRGDLTGALVTGSADAVGRFRAQLVRATQ